MAPDRELHVSPNSISQSDCGAIDEMSQPNPDASDVAFLNAFVDSKALESVLQSWIV